MLIFPFSLGCYHLAHLPLMICYCVHYQKTVISLLMFFYGGGGGGVGRGNGGVTLGVNVLK